MEFEFGMGVEEFADDVLVFFRFEAAGAVEECAAGFQQGSGLVQQVELSGSEAIQFFGADAPAEFDATAHDAGVRAGSVEEETIQGVVGDRGRGTGKGKRG
jgi:hypothetical protein